MKSDILSERIRSLYPEVDESETVSSLLSGPPGKGLDIETAYTGLPGLAYQKGTAGFRDIQYLRRDETSRDIFQGKWKDTLWGKVETDFITLPLGELSEAVRQILLRGVRQYRDEVASLRSENRRLRTEIERMEESRSLVFQLPENYLEEEPEGI